MTLPALYFPGLMFIFCVPQNNRPGPPGTKGAKGHRGPEGSAVSAPLRVFMCFPYWSMIQVVDIVYHHSCSQIKVPISMILCTNHGLYLINKPNLKILAKIKLDKQVLLLA